jgi:hypothetical protein
VKSEQRVRRRTKKKKKAWSAGYLVGGESATSGEQLNKWRVDFFLNEWRWRFYLQGLFQFQRDAVIESEMEKEMIQRIKLSRGRVLNEFLFESELERRQWAKLKGFLSFEFWYLIGQQSF